MLKDKVFESGLQHIPNSFSLVFYSPLNLYFVSCISIVFSLLSCDPEQTCDPFLGHDPPVENHWAGERTDPTVSHPQTQQYIPV